MRDAGIKVEKDVIDNAIKYVRELPESRRRLQLHGAAGRRRSGFARSAAGVASLYYAGVFEGDEINRGLKYLKRFTPGQAATGSATWKATTSATTTPCRRCSWPAATTGRKWYPAIRDQLISAQDTGRVVVRRSFSEDYAHRDGADHPADAQPLSAGLHRQRAGELKADLRFAIANLRLPFVAVPGWRGSSRRRLSCAEPVVEKARAKNGQAARRRSRRRDQRRSSRPSSAGSSSWPRASKIATDRSAAQDRAWRTSGITALSGLAFMEGGNLPGRGKYGENVRSAVELHPQLRAGIRPAFAEQAHGVMYSHGFATLFLAEVYGMTGDENVKEKLQRPSV